MQGWCRAGAALESRAGVRDALVLRYRQSRGQTGSGVEERAADGLVWRPRKPVSGVAKDGRREQCW